jgi:hypothetical protein
MSIGTLTRRVDKLAAHHAKPPVRFLTIEMDYRRTEEEARAELGIEPCCGATFLMFLPIYDDAERHVPSRLITGSHARTEGNVP